VATRVIIVRHGQSSYNAQKRIQGRINDSVLTEKGIADAGIVGATLSNVSIDVFYCSPLQRARKTAEIIHSHLKNPPQLQPSDKLLEIDLPLWEKLEKSEVKASYPEDYQLWKESPDRFKMLVTTNEGEKEYYPVVSLYQQAQEFWQEVLSQNQGKTILIVAHNGINRCLLMSALGMPVALYQSIQQSNCCINVLNFSGDWGSPVQLESLNQTAHLGIKIPPTRPSHQGLRLLLVRHGETQWNRESRFQGIRDIPLNDRGREQARSAADFLNDVEIDFALSSPMSRPKETAEIILEPHTNIELSTDDRLKEICHGLWEGKLESEIETDFPGMLQQWKDKPETVQMPEGENIDGVWDRAIEAWQDTVAQYSNPETSPTGLVVAHDAINKVILCYLLGLRSSDIWAVKQGNCAVTVIDYPQGAMGLPVIQALNITNHLGSGILDRTAAGAL
jgi:phosphoserine phosphatase